MTTSAPDGRSEEGAGEDAEGVTTARHRPAGLVAAAVLVVLAAGILALVRRRAR